MAANIKERPNTKRPARKQKESMIRRTVGDIDYLFLFLVVVLLAFGLVMLLSASSPYGSTRMGDPYYFFSRQLLFASMGLVGMIIIARMDYRKYKKYVPTAMIICTILLVLVLLPYTGKSLNGSKRWLNLPINFQPSEAMKPVIAMYFALLIENGTIDLTTNKGKATSLVIILVVAALLMLETHLSGTIVICGIAFTVLIAAGFPVKPILVSVIPVAVIGLVLLYNFDEVRWARVAGFINPFHDAQNTTYQIIQSLYAIGSGGIFGLGLGQSVQKFSALPEPYNDFIYAVICEELGLFGAILVIGLFVLLIMRGIRIAMNAPDKFSCLTAVGIMAQVAIQAVLNIAVATSSVPNTGVALPFFSYGGTAIMVLMLEMGVMLSISKYSKANVQDTKEIEEMKEMTKNSLY